MENLDDLRKDPIFVGGIVIVFIILSVLLASVAHADCPWSDTQIADAIHRAENSKSNPYGILVKYRTTSPRRACLNTIRHAMRDWSGEGDFISYLGARYCPVGCDNDNGTNQFWVKNVKFYLKGGENK